MSLDALVAELTAGGIVTQVLEARVGSAVIARVESREAVPGGERLGSDRVAYRRLVLEAGGAVLSRCENWYAADRLTPEMLAALAGDTPFGRVIAPLRPRRETLSVERLGDDPILRIHALVLSGEGDLLAEVVETYTAHILRGSMETSGTPASPRSATRSPSSKR